MRRFIASLAGLLLAGSGLSVISSVAAPSPVQAAGVGQYSAPEWFPMRYNGSSEVKVGCTYLSKGSQGGYDCADQKYPNGYHTWWALDLMAGIGTPVYAAGAGQVVGTVKTNSGCSASSNYVQVNHNGSYTYYTHLAAVNVNNGDWVDQNTQIGTVGETGLAAEGCAEHLHYEKRSGTTQGTAINPGELKACHGSTLTSYPAKWGLSTWQGIPWGTRYAHSDGTGCGGGGGSDADGDGVADTTDMCPSERGKGFLSGCPERIGALGRGGVLEVKEGGIGAGWVTVQGEVRQFAMSNRRIGIVMSDGSAYVKEGGVGAGWVLVSGEVRQLAMTGDRIAMLKYDGSVWVKEGSVSASWVLINGAAKQIAMTGYRIGVLHTNGDLEVKEGPIDSAWVLEQGAVSRFALSGNRIGVVFANGAADIKEGGLGAGWIALNGAVKDLQLSGTRILVLHTDGSVSVKEGYIGNGWVAADGATGAIAVSPDRLGTVHVDGTAYAKEGGIDAGWVTIQGNVSRMCFNLDCATPAFTPPMASTALPTITGTPRVGVKLYASSGTWSPAATGYAYQWFADGVAISGATASGFTPTAGHKGKKISVRVTASKAGYVSKSATSAQTAVVAAGIITNKSLPYITGTKRVGYTLTAYVGSWSPGGLTYRYQWFKGTTAISGATARTYKLPAGVRGYRIRVRVTAVRTGYTSLSKYSAYTTTIQ